MKRWIIGALVGACAGVAAYLVIVKKHGPLAKAQRRNLNNLEIPLELPIRDGALVLPNFPFARPNVVVNEFLAEQIPRDRACLEQRRSVGKRSWQRPCVRLVSAAR